MIAKWSESLCNLKLGWKASNAGERPGESYVNQTRSALIRRTKGPPKKWTHNGLNCKRRSPATDSLSCGSSPAGLPTDWP